MRESEISERNDNIYIIPLKKENINEVCAIEKECFTDPWSQNVFIEVFGSPIAVKWAAVEADETTNEIEIVGYCIFYPIWDECEIMNIAVKKSKRHRKIATKLFFAVLEYAKIENICRIILEVRQSNDEAIALYKKFGFEVDGVRKNYYKNPKEDAILMSLKLK